MPTPEELKAQQRDLWGSAALTWERHDAWFQKQTKPLTDWMCEAAGLRSGMQVLDVACGAGQPAITAARRVGERGRVVATDLSSDMVAATRRMAEKAELDNIETRVMDAEHLDFRDMSFDAVTCRFGLMFCPDPVAAATEIRRVLRPGGRFAVAVWDEQAKNLMFTVIDALFKEFNPAPPPDPKAPDPFRLAPPGELESVLKQAGFAEPTIESRPMTFDYNTPEDFWAIRSEMAAALKAAIAKLPADQVTRLHDAVIEAVQPYVENGRVRLTATPLCATGRR